MLVTAGAAAALFCVATTLLEPGDHAVVVRTNYATNLETPRAIGADLDVVDLRFDDGWRLDVEHVAERVRDGQTRLISVTQPHNPTGTMLDRADPRRRSSSWRSAPAPCCSSTRPTATSPTASRCRWPRPCPRGCISVSSMSKAYGLPGLRIGWAVVPRPCSSAERLLAAKEQMLICGATLDERIAGSVLAGAVPTVLPPILDDVRDRLGIVRDWMAGQSTFEWVEPAGGVVGLVRFRPDVEVDTDRFYEVLLADHGTYVGPGHWFELDDRHFRLGYGWPTHDELRAGLARAARRRRSASG